MSYHFCLRFIQTLVLGLFLSLNYLLAEEKPIRVRDAAGKCGFYIQSALTGNNRKRVSDLSKEGIERSIKEVKKLKDVEFVLLAPESAEHAAELVRFTEAKVLEAGGEPGRVKVLRRGLYVSPLNKPSTGIWVADDEKEAVEEFFSAKPDLRNSQIYYVGPRIYGNERAEAESFIQTAMQKHGYSDLKLTILSNPEGLADEIRWFFPMKEDWQRPTLAELLPSLGFFLLSNATFAVIMLLTEESPAHAIPVIVVNALQSLSMTAPRQFWGNYFMRARNFSEKFGRQFLISIVFSVGLYASHIFGKEGLGAVGTALFTFAGLGIMFSNLWIKALFQSAWRIPVESGIPAWVASETRKGNEQRARAFGTWYRQGATNIATPAWGYSTITESYLFEFLKKWTWGDVIMAGVGLTFAAANRMPKIYNFPILVYDGTKKKLSAAGRLAGRIRDNVKWLSSLSQKLTDSDENPWKILRQENQSRPRIFGRQTDSPQSGGDDSRVGQLSE